MDSVRSTVTGRRDVILVAIISAVATGLVAFTLGWLVRGWTGPAPASQPSMADAVSFCPAST